MHWRLVCGKPCVFGAVHEHREGRGEKVLPSSTVHADCHKAHQIYCNSFWTALIYTSEKLLQTSPLNEQFVHLPGVSPSHSNMFLPALACLLTRMARQGELVEGWQMTTSLLLKTILSSLLVWKESSTNVTKTHFYLFDMLAVRYQSLPSFPISWQMFFSRNFITLSPSWCWRVQLAGNILIGIEVPVW